MGIGIRHRLYQNRPATADKERTGPNPASGPPVSFLHSRHPVAWRTHPLTILGLLETGPGTIPELTLGKPDREQEPVCQLFTYITAPSLSCLAA